MSDEVKQIEEFCNLWRMMRSSFNLDKRKEEYPRIESLTTMEISIITIVYEREDIILKEICTILDIPKSTLTSAIDRLERLNYINRTVSKRDRRSFGLQLTEEGYAVLDERIELEKQLYGSILNALDTNEEKEILLDLLRKIVKKI